MRLFRRKRRAAEPVDGPEAEAPGVEGAEPTPPPPSRATVTSGAPLFHDGHYTRNLERSSRVLLSVAGVAVGAFLGTVAWNFSLYPLKTTRTEYIIFGDGQYMHLEKGRLSETTVSLMVEETLREYIAKRETIDHTTEGERFTWIRAHTDPGWYKPWADFVSPKNPTSPLEEYRKKDLRRKVFVETLSRTSTPNEWRAEVVFIDDRMGHEVGRSNWVIILKAERETITGAADIARLNPLGLIVSAYDVSPRSKLDADTAAGVTRNEGNTR